MRNNKKKTDMDKKRYMAPQMKIKKVVTQGFLTISNPNITRGQVITDDDGEYDESENPSFDSNGSVFGD
jgi:hypothetical protein